MSEIPRKVESNIKERATSGRSTVNREVTIGKTAIRDLVSLKPVKMTIDFTVDTLDNIGDFIKKQAEITRRWIS